MVQSELVAELRHCAELLNQASRRDWPKLQHVASRVSELADRAAVTLSVVLKDGVVPGYVGVTRIWKGWNDFSGPIGWSIRRWSVVFIPTFHGNRSGYHGGKAQHDAKGRPLSTNGRPLRVVKHRDGSTECSGELATESALGPIQKYDADDEIEHWRRRAADYAEVCDKVAGLIEKAGESAGRQAVATTETETGEILSKPLTLKAIAGELHMSVRTLHRWRKRGRVVLKPDGTKYRYRQVDK